MITQALMCVFKEWTYILIAVVVALFVFVLATWLPNLGLIWKITVSPSAPLLDKAKILASLVGSIQTNFTVFAALYLSFPKTQIPEAATIPTGQIWAVSSIFHGGGDLMI